MNFGQQNSNEFRLFWLVLLGRKRRVSKSAESEKQEEGSQRGVPGHWRVPIDRGALPGAAGSGRQEASALDGRESERRPRIRADAAK